MTHDQIDNSPLATAYGMTSLFVDTSESQKLLMTLWAAHTHIYRDFVASPRLSFVADGPGTGKSVAMSVALSMSNEPLAIGYASQASVYSWLEEHPNTTLGLDEIDKVFGVMGRKTSRAVLAAVVNDGYSASGKVMVMRGGRPVLMPIYSPVATAGIGQLPEDTRTRALEIRLTRGAPSELFVPELHSGMMADVGTELWRYLRTREVRKALSVAPNVADGVEGSPRLRLILAPLAAIADAAGLGELFRASVVEWQSGEADIPVRPTHEILAADVAALLSDAPLTAGQLAEVLADTTETWSSLPPGRVGADYVASLLRQAGVLPIRSGSRYGYTSECVNSE